MLNNMSSSNILTDETQNIANEESIQSLIMSDIMNYGVKRETIINDIHNEKYINKFVDHIYIINLCDDYIRQNYIRVLMEKYQINFELIIVDRITQTQYDKMKKYFRHIGEYGCYLSHMYCFNDAIQNNYENIIIFEDDIVLHKQFHSLFENVMNAKKYDMLMLGAADFNFGKNKELVDKTKGIYRPSLDTLFLFGTHAIYYSKEGIQRMIAFKMENISHMDFNLVYLLTKSLEFLYVCSPNLAVVELSTTSINHTFWVGYKPVLDNYYYRKCFNHELNFTDYNFIYLELFKNITFTNDVSFSDNILNSIEKKFTDEQIKKKIKERLCFDFFTNVDLFKIIKT